MTKLQKLEIIADGVRAFDELEICKTALNPVPGEGNPDAKVVFIGEAPGAKEDELGRPFVGRSGQLLDQMIGLLGLRRSDVFITNVVKWRPPENRDPTVEEVERGKEFLMAQLSVIQPKIVVTLGRFSMYVMLGSKDRKISEVHGKLFDQVNAGFLVYPVYHPSASFRKGDYREALTEDFLKLKKFLEKEEII